ncbi:DUF108 domain-containing protein [Defluviimonas sp. WL0002]|uniref:DUF108 domain-containing protein n=1 Tax=Albidovulum marisflavi TaxID=2984159 RepID=A0ABT2ZCY4_9RHOB|nr:aspartate dehydrogenase domain-containing protein [Defluviimonas sp. WL0002]MCV2868930.1 DUF108 domain-containing protein [Defluviimonas sp. WL0002]
MTPVPGGARTISIIGAGRIGLAVIGYVRATPGLALGRVLTRGGLPDTGDPRTFFDTPADLVIDTAGPEALRAFGPVALARAELWTVGAAALADPLFRADIERAAARGGTAIRLFSPWFAGVGHGAPGNARGLHVRAERPGIGKGWSGPLSDAVSLFPDDLNSAVAAALCGPGIQATTVELADSGPNGAHRIEARLEADFATFHSAAVFRDTPGALHPTAAAIIGRLRNLAGGFMYG